MSSPFAQALLMPLGQLWASCAPLMPVFAGGFVGLMLVLLTVVVCRLSFAVVRYGVVLPLQASWMLICRLYAHRRELRDIAAAHREVSLAPTYLVGKLGFDADSETHYLESSHGDSVFRTVIPQAYVGLFKADPSGKESLMPRSHAVSSELPKFVVVLRDGDRVVGCGARVELPDKTNGVLTAHHVIAQLRLASDPRIGGLKSHTKMHPSWELLFSSPKMDLAFVKVPANVFSQYGISVAKLARTPREGSMVQVYRVEGGAAFVARGYLSSPSCLKFRHDASTLPGTSGSPMIRNDKVIGIHTEGDTGSGKNGATGVDYFMDLAFAKESDPHSTAVFRASEVYDADDTYEVSWRGRHRRVDVGFQGYHDDHEVFTGESLKERGIRLWSDEDDFFDQGDYTGAGYEAAPAPSGDSCVQDFHEGEVSLPVQLTEVITPSSQTEESRSNSVSKTLCPPSLHTSEARESESPPPEPSTPASPKPLASPTLNSKSGPGPRKTQGQSGGVLKSTQEGTSGVTSRKTKSVKEQSASSSKPTPKPESPLGSLPVAWREILRKENVRVPAKRSLLTLSECTILVRALPSIDLELLTKRARLAQNGQRMKPSEYLSVTQLREFLGVRTGLPTRASSTQRS